VKARLGQLSALALGLALPAAAQVVQQQPYTLEVRVDLVSITAVVYDKAGHFVVDLGPGDVEVYENGVLQEVSIFQQAKGGEEKIPLSVMLVLDASGSMNENLHFLQEAALTFVYKLEDVDQAQVVQFNESIKGSADFTGDIDRLERFIEGLQAWGGTSLFDAIHYGLNRVRDQPGRKALVVFSDGEDTTSTMKDQEVVDYARSVEATVYTVGISGMGGRSPRGFLKKVAQETGGAYFFPDDVGDLVQVFAKISEELHNHYLLAYAPKRPADGTWREIEVRLRNRPDVQLRVRKGYFAVAR
jgi:Ca-activated chloride channel homolog